MKTPYKPRNINLKNNIEFIYENNSWILICQKRIAIQIASRQILYKSLLSCKIENKKKHVKKLRMKKETFIFMFTLIG